jgi:ABC-2 type transport system permease protein
VIWQHFTAFVWLRWRLLVNQSRRAGALNAVLMMIVVVAVLLMAIPLFFACYALGLYAIPEATPTHLLYVSDALIAAFLLFWGIGLLTELQRTESLALSKFLHLPVSPTGAFLINYVSSLLRLSLIVFAPVMLGFALALVSTKGLLLLLTLPLLAAFLLMVTALTYQFQGWLASLMSNPRRRRTVIVTATMTFILICQLPNLLNFLAPWGVQQRAQRSTALVEELATLNRAFAAHEFDAVEHVRRQRDVMDRYKLADERAQHETTTQIERIARLANVALPVGWLPHGVMSAAEGRVLPSLLGLTGMTLIATVSLWRAYRTTVGQYQGHATNRRRRPAPVVAQGEGSRAPGTLLLEARIPGLSEPAAAIALAGLRSLMRAPEAKMMLLSPLITAVIFGSMLWKGRHGIPEFLRPQIALGAMVFVLLGMMQIAGNQFGFDRDGFRVFVLCSARRRDILLGKNLSFAPLALGLAAIQLAVVQVICPLRIDHFLAMLPLYVSMFLLFCLFANVMSIQAPLSLAAGSLKASNQTLKVGLLQLVFFLVLFPLAMAPAFLPLTIESGLRLLDWTTGMPIGLILAMAESAAVIVLYRLSLRWQGELLQAREQRILESVTNRAT